MENKISGYFINRIKSYFYPEWIFFIVGTVLFIYSILNLLKLFIVYDIMWQVTLFPSIIFLAFFSIQHFFISGKIKSRLIYKIQETDDLFILTTYNKSKIKINKNETPLEREPRDYIISSLFATRTGSIRILPKNNNACIVKIDNKKYYLTPNLFEHEFTTIL
jgi:hypothetical protein